jgi:hypothetical protein
VPTEAGPHLLRLRCFPLTSAYLPVILAPHETLHVVIYIGVLDDLQIDIAPVNERLQPRGQARR